MNGFFNSFERKETSFFWQFIVTNPEEVPFSITEYDDVWNVLNKFEFKSNEIDRVISKINSVNYVKLVLRKSLKKKNLFSWRQLNMIFKTKTVRFLSSLIIQQENNIASTMFWGSILYIGLQPKLLQCCNSKVKIIEISMF